MAFFKVFDLVPGVVWAALLAVALFLGWSEHAAHLNTKFKMAEFKQQAAEKEAARAVVAQQAETLRADITALRATRAQEINDAIREERRMARAAVAADVPVRDQLRHDTVTLTARSDKGSDGAAALKRAEETARAFGGLLVTCDAVAESLAGDSEDLASQVRGLQAQYESLSLRPRPTTLDPFPNRDEVHPSSRLRWHDVMYSPLPDLASQPSVDFRLSLVGVMP